MNAHQGGDRTGDRSGQVPEVSGDSCPCVLTRTGPTLAPKMALTARARALASLAVIDRAIDTIAKVPDSVYATLADALAEIYGPIPTAHHHQQGACTP
jgi:hypothetical protein